MKKIIFWLPRVLAAAYIVFISLFALDSFSGEKAFSREIADFAIHLIPSIILILVLIIAWKWEWIGTLVYLLMALLYIYFSWEAGHFSWMLFISGPLFLIAFLFLINWIVKKAIRVPEKFQ